MGPIHFTSNFEGSGTKYFTLSVTVHKKIGSVFSLKQLSLYNLSTKRIFLQTASSSKKKSNICKQNLSHNLMPSNKTSTVLESIKYLQEGNYFHLSLTIKYLVSETMLPGADTIWYGHKSLWTNTSGPSCPRHRGQVLQMLSPSRDPGTAGASWRLETLFVKASPAPCKQGASGQKCAP